MYLLKIPPSALNVVSSPSTEVFKSALADYVSATWQKGFLHWNRLEAGLDASSDLFCLEVLLILWA